MKKIFLLFFIAISFSAQSQLDYTFAKSTGTYTELSSPTIATKAWPMTFHIKMPFQFKFFNKNYDSLKITPNSISFTSNKADFISMGQENYYYTNTTYPPGSEISYAITGSAPNRIIKVQFKNLRAATIDTADRYIVNNQIWIYETTNVIQMHVGPNNITDLNFETYYFTMLDYDNSPYLAISGSAASPTFVQVMNAGTFKGINSHPADGTIYTFTPNTGTGIRSVDKPYVFSHVAEGFTVAGRADATISMFDITGKEIVAGTIDETGLFHYAFNDLTAGVYLVNIQQGDQIFTEKVLVH
ncbi:MAG: T9SS type A sorting domain-containing protein [Bacteroidota bacterium]